jgi:capsule polysaccharide export protein KpsE/RkpR
LRCGEFERELKVDVGQHFLQGAREAKVESLRQDAVIHEIDPVTEIEFPSPAGVEGTQDQPDRDALYVLHLLWEKRRMLFRVAAWALVLSTVIAFLIPNQYESSIRIMPPDPMSGSGTMLAALASKATPELAALAGSLIGTKSSGALYVDLFRSRSVQDRVVDRLNLQKVYWSRYKQDARKKLDSRTDVGEDRKSGLISLSVTDKNPQRARDIAQAYLEELNRLLAQVSTSSARRERVFIEQRLTSVKSDLEDAEKQFSGFASKNSTLDIKEQTKAMVESAAMLQGELIAAQSELQSLEQIYTSNNVRVRSLQARVDELKRQAQNLQGTDASLMPDAPSTDLYPPIRKLPLLGVEWTDLYRRLKIQETVFELLTQQYELARIQEAKEIPTINVVDPANVPERKSSPHRLIIILALTLLSLVGAAVWIVGSERWEHVDPQDPGKMLAENVWREGSDRVHTWLTWALVRLRLSRSSTRDAGESSE